MGARQYVPGVGWRERDYAGQSIAESFDEAPVEVEEVDLRSSDTDEKPAKPRRRVRDNPQA